MIQKEHSEAQRRSYEASFRARVAGVDVDGILARHFTPVYRYGVRDIEEVNLSHFLDSDKFLKTPQVYALEECASTADLPPICIFTRPSDAMYVLGRFSDSAKLSVALAECPLVVFDNYYVIRLTEFLRKAAHVF